MTTSIIDADLRQILRRHDPARAVSLIACATLEMRITAATMSKTQRRVVTVSLFPAPKILRWQVPWPIVTGGTMVLGLALGLCLSILTETQNQPTMTIAAVTTPWSQFMQ